MKSYLNHQCVSINGVHTDVFTRLGEKDSTTHVILIPGNPGVAAYYDDFAKELVHSLSQDPSYLNSTTHPIPIPTITAISYAGFTKHPRPIKSYSIEEELDHKIDVIDYLIQTFHPQCSQTRFILVGHSIGAWIAAKIIEKRPQLPIDKCIMLFPFLAVDQTSAFQARLKRLISMQRLRKIVFFINRILVRLPIFVKKYLLNAFAADQHQKSKQTTLEYFGSLDHISESVIHMAGTEFESLNTPIDPLFYQKHADKLEFWYTQNDVWAPIQQASLLADQVKGLHIQFLQDVPHAFVVDPDYTRKVAQSILQKSALKTIVNKRKSHHNSSIRTRTQARDQIRDPLSQQ